MNLKYLEALFWLVFGIGFFCASVTFAVALLTIG